jgi:hypothetical protein
MILLQMNMVDIGIAAAFMFLICIAWLLAEFKGMKDELKERLGLNNNTIQLRLQAYERLTLFADRVSLKSLVTRTSFSTMSVVDFQLTLLETIRTEYEYNVSQQIYVSNDMWRAIANLKDQNIYIINQIAATLPSQAAAVELSKRILEYASNKNAELNTIVAEALQIEAKELM